MSAARRQTTDRENMKTINVADRTGDSRRIELYFESLSDAIADVDHLHREGWSRAGNWSLGQILDHLNITLRFSFGDIPFYLPMPIRPIVKLVFWPTIVKGKPIRLRGVAPKKLQPRSEPDESVVVKEFTELVQRHINPNIEFAPIHPVFGRLARQDWLLVQKWHVTHHVNFMLHSIERTV
jgi:hypothetical protein